MDIWREVFQSNEMRLIRFNTEYMWCKFSQSESRDELSKLKITRYESVMRYLGSCLEQKGWFKLDIVDKIGVGWAEWSQAAGVLCD